MTAVSSLREAASPDRPQSTSHASGNAAFAPMRYLPGIALAVIVTAAAYAMRQIPGLAIFSPMILAVVIGIVYANLVGTPENTRAGIAFCQRSVLRFAIVLLGFQLTVTQVASIGASGVAVVVLALGGTFLFTIGFGRLLGVDAKLAQLIAAGTSICGASAVVATNAVTGADDEDVAYAVAAVTVFGTIAMLTYPLLAPVLGLDQHAFGLWAGASIHEIAQVVGASFQVGPQAGEIGTIAKLSRVVLLAPVVLTLGAFASRGAGASGARPPVPWFVFAFLAVVGFNSFVTVPQAIKQDIVFATTFLLSIGLGAMGLHTHVGKIRLRGLRPLALALSAFVFIASFSLLLVELLA